MPQRIGRPVRADGELFHRAPFTQVVKLRTKFGRYDITSIHGTGIHVGNGYYLTAAHNLHKKGAPSTRVSWAAFYVYDPAARSWIAHPAQRVDYARDFFFPSGYLSTTDPYERASLDFAILKGPVPAWAAAAASDNDANLFNTETIREWTANSRDGYRRLDRNRLDYDLFVFGFPKGAYAPHIARFDAIGNDRPSVGLWGLPYLAPTREGFSGGPVCAHFKNVGRPYPDVIALHHGEVRERGDVYQLGRTLTGEVWRMIDNALAGILGQDTSLARDALDPTPTGVGAVFDTLLPEGVTSRFAPPSTVNPRDSSVPDESEATAPTDPTPR